MKKLAHILLYSLPFTLTAQTIDRTKAPAPGKAPIIQVGNPVKYTLANGLQIFVVKNTKLPTVAATLVINIEGIKEGDKAGMSEMAGQLLRRGTTKMTKEVLDEAVEYLGGSISTSGLSASASSLKYNFPKLFELMSQVVLHPTLSAAELEKVRTQTLSGIESSKDNADAISSNVINKLVYGSNHPFGEHATTKSVNAVKVEDIKKYIDNYWKPNIAYLIFVGDIEPAAAKALAEKGFGSWQKGNVAPQVFPKPAKPTSTYIAIVDRPASVQSVVAISSTIDLVKGAPNDISATVMNNILGGSFSGRLFNNLREQHGFTYGAYSSLKPNKQIGIFTAEASVRNEKTDSSIQEILHEINIIRNQKVGDTELSRMKNYLAGGFARSLESPATIANFALNITKYNLPADYYQKYLTKLAAINANNVQLAAKELLNPAQMHIVIVGNAKQIAKGLEKYGAVKYFDIEGNEIEAPQEAKSDASLTPNKLIENITTAMGGAALDHIKDVQFIGKVNVMGQSLDMTQKLVIPGNAVQTMSMGAMVISKQAVVNGKYEMSQQGQQAPITDEIKEGLDESAILVPEKSYIAKGYKFNIVGAEKVEGKDAIDVELISPSGKKSHRYYDALSFLLVKIIKIQEVPGKAPVVQQEFYKNYQSIEGVLFAKETVIDLGQFKMNINYNEIKVNQGLSVADLK